jgi:tRNA(adenine34) deaminase
MNSEPLEAYMRIALEEAMQAEAEGEVPVGAAVVYEGRVLSRAHNQKEFLADPTAHAEILALRAAASCIGHWRLIDADLFVTLEPCAMCAGAMVQARIHRCIYAAEDPKAGAAGSICNLLGDQRLNHQVEVVPGILREESAALLRRFFQDRRG